MMTATPGLASLLLEPFWWGFSTRRSASPKHGRALHEPHLVDDRWAFLDRLKPLGRAWGPRPVDVALRRLTLLSMDVMLFFLDFFFFFFFIIFLLSPLGAQRPVLFLATAKICWHALA
ncbi:hypothetical protein M441DRAFT_424907 [Trichoderma asperellum CBS 433.97]|uniref:Uncharacterized protein n=1 Tax=Trichoderma asperellum (strain ATCC 204424 / CBS 433.97 / NBRC 101777) TaxID=1042311 RepID=A0A2T3Z5A7_TRIA4|nr:hypothetical protein M441DRAFT_424907 [Trichoderma asperellum CBS 433.97]PTB40011.1 hypothetical protein M441DRAFT_424907 [Trichoderma asperellum CBS 433.97]